MAKKRTAKDDKLMEALEGYYTTDQAAKILGMNQKSVNKAITQNRLSAVRVGNNWLISKKALEDYERDRKNPGPLGQNTRS